MANFFHDNSDLTFIFSQLQLEPIVSLMENGFQPDETHAEVHGDYHEAMDYFETSLELLGTICANDIAPKRQQIDEQGTQFVDGKVHYAKGSEEARQLLSESGFMGAILPREYGGAHVPASIYMMMIEIVSRADASLMTMFGYQDVGELIARFGTRAQSARFLPQLASGEHIGAIVLSEPGAGSDLQSIRVKAHQNENGQWYLNGTKHFISNGCGDVLMVLARSEPEIDNIFGLSLFVCRGGDEVKVNRVEEKMGLHGSPTCELSFENAPCELIGKRKFGLTKYILESLSQARFSVAAQALGIAEGAYQSALEYAHQRRQFGKNIIDIPAVADLLLQMQVALESSRALLYFGAYWLDVKVQHENYIAAHKQSGQDLKPKQKILREAQQKSNLLSPMIKYVITEAANRVCYNAQQIFGGMGYIKETGIEQLVRDVRITTIYEGTSQVQVAGSIKAVLADTLAGVFSEKSKRSSEYLANPEFCRLNEQVEQMRTIFLQCRDRVIERGDDYFTGASAEGVVDSYAAMLASHLLQDQIEQATSKDLQRRKYLLTKRYISESLAQTKALLSRLENNIYNDKNDKALLFGTPE